MRRKLTPRLLGATLLAMMFIGHSAWQPMALPKPDHHQPAAVTP